MTLFCGPDGKTSRWRYFTRGWSAGNHIMFLVHTHFSLAQVACLSCHPQMHSYTTVTSVKEPVLDAALPDCASRSGPPLQVDSSLPSVLPVLHTLPLANATTDFSLSLTFFICKVSVAATTSLGGCENHTDSLIWYQPRWAPSRWQPSWGQRVGHSWACCSPSRAGAVPSQHKLDPLQ